VSKLSINKAGTWYTAKKFWIKVGGTWQQAKKMWINKAGTWHLIGFIEPTFSTIESQSFTNTGDILFSSAGGTNDYLGRNWLSFTGTGNGAAYWIRFIKTTSGPTPPMTGGSYNTWINMTGNVTMTFLSVPAGVIRSASGTYEVSDNSGSTVLGTGNWTLTVDNS
jgi:hypothetical protein